jgi:excisionase family DNA binding protein
MPRPHTDAAFNTAERPAMIEPMQTVEEFASWANIGRTTAFEEIKTGRLRAVKIGRCTRITPEARRDWRDRLPQALARP